MNLGFGIGLWQHKLRWGSFNPSSLFSAGQQGFWSGGYDPALGRLWQDSAGGTPVTEAGQPVGLVLDAISGSETGPELLINGDFSDGDDGWTLGTGWTFTDDEMVYSGGLAANNLSQAWPGMNGAAYKTRIIADMLSTPDALAAIRINIGGLGQDIILDSKAGLVSGDRVDFTRFGFSSTSATWIARIGSNLNYQMDFKLRLASIKKLTVAPAWQATALSRPTLRQSGSVWYLEDDGGDSLPITLPAGTYGRATVNASGLVTIDTVVDPADALASNQQVDVILRQGAFTPEEEANIRTYWARYAA